MSQKGKGKALSEPRVQESDNESPLSQPPSDIEDQVRTEDTTAAEDGHASTSAQAAPVKSGKLNTKQKTKMAALNTTKKAGKAKADTTDKPGDELKMEKKIALSKNPPGVMVISQAISESAKSLAGYLGMGESMDLENVMKILEVNQNAARLRVALKAGVGIPQKTNMTLPNVGKVFEAIVATEAVDKKAITDLLQDTPASWHHTDESYFPVFGKRSMTFAYKLCILVMHRILKSGAIPSGLPGGTEIHHGQTIEDWHRAWHLMRFCVNNFPKPQKLRGPSKKTHYLTDSDLQGGLESTENNDPGQHAVATRDLDFEHGLQDEDPDLDDPETYDEFMQSLANDLLEEDGDINGDGELKRTQFEKDIQGVISSLAGRNAAPRPAMSEAEIKRFLMVVGEKVKVLHEDVSDARRLTDIDIAMDKSPNTAIDTESYADDFYALRRIVAHKSAGIPSYKEAVALLVGEDAEVSESGQVRARTVLLPDPQHSGEFLKVELHPLQVVAVAWMINMQRLPFSGGILAMDVGTGKTITCLWYLAWMAAETEKKFAAGETDVDVRPHLICVPSGNLLKIWYDEYMKYFRNALELRIYHGTPNQQQSSARRDITLEPDYKKAIHQLYKLCNSGSTDTTKSLKGCRVVMLTTYATYAHRGLVLCTKSEYDRQKEQSVAGRSKHSIPHELYETELPDDDEDRDLDAEAREAALAYPLDRDETELAHGSNTASKDEIDDNAVVFRSYFGGLFRTFIGDEFQYCKNTRSRNHRGPYTTDAPDVFMVSATPADNSIADELGTLNMAWKPDWRPQNTPKANPGNYKTDAIEKFMHDNPEYAKKFQNEPMYLLDPKPYAALLNNDQLKGENVTTVLGKIHELSRIRMTAATKIMDGKGEDFWLGREIPPYKCHTVEIEANAKEQKIYNAKFKRVQDKISRRAKKGGKGQNRRHPIADTKGLRDNGIHRQLSVSTTHPLLDRFEMKYKIKDTSKYSLELAEKDGDYGASLFFRQTRPDANLLPPTTRLGMAYYIAQSSPKLRYLCKLILRHVYDKGEKMVVWYRWPVEGWLVSMLLDVLGIKFMHIGSTTDAAEREKLLEQWQEPEHAVRILVASVLVLGAGTNMQKGCHVAVCLSMADNINQHVQILGRQHRYGQQHEQVFYVITLVKSYDQILQAKTFKKALLQVLGDADIGELTVDKSELMKEARKCLKPDAEDEDVEEYLDKIINEHYTRTASDYLCRLLGLRCSRLDWDTLDLYEPWDTEEGDSNVDSLTSRASIDRGKLIRDRWSSHTTSKPGSSFGAMVQKATSSKTQRPQPPKTISESSSVQNDQSDTTSPSGRAKKSQLQGKNTKRTAGPAEDPPAAKKSRGWRDRGMPAVDSSDDSPSRRGGRLRKQPDRFGQK